MQLRIGVATKEKPLAETLAGWMVGVRAFRLTSEAELWTELRRGQLDLVVLDHAFVRSAEKLAAVISALSETVDVIVLGVNESPTERAGWTAAGCVGVLSRDLAEDVLADALQHLIQRVSERVLRRLDVETIEKRSSLSEFVALSPAMQHFVGLARRIVSGARAVLILGETGVGKERLARSLHSESPRAAGPFITVNCGALSESLLESELFGHEEGAFTGASRARRGYFELADKGTIFLDEIGEMPAHLQVKLLRVLEDRRIQRLGGERSMEIDVRFMAATNRELRTEMAEGRFRPDLYYRLAVVSLTVPPLRQRREDIEELANTFLNRFRRQFARPVKGFTAEARAALIEHDWPGNVRELMNVIERAVLLTPAETIRLEDLRGGAAFSADPHLGEQPVQADRMIRLDTEDRSRAGVPLAVARRAVISEFETRYLTDLLTRHQGKIGVAAQHAGVSERTLYALMKKHGLSKEAFK